jgi:hypothetical protein
MDLDFVKHQNRPKKKAQTIIKYYSRYNWVNFFNFSPPPKKTHSCLCWSSRKWLVFLFFVFRLWSKLCILLCLVVILHLSFNNLFWWIRLFFIFSYPCICALLSDQLLLNFFFLNLFNTNFPDTIKILLDQFLVILCVSFQTWQKSQQTNGLNFFFILSYHKNTIHIQHFRSFFEIFFWFFFLFVLDGGCHIFLTFLFLYFICFFFFSFFVIESGVSFAYFRLLFYFFIDPFSFFIFYFLMQFTVLIKDQMRNIPEHRST